MRGVEPSLGLVLRRDATRAGERRDARRRCAVSTASRSPNPSVDVPLRPDRRRRRRSDRRRRRTADVRIRLERERRPQPVPVSSPAAPPPDSDDEIVIDKRFGRRRRPRGRRHASTCSRSSSPSSTSIVGIAQFGTADSPLGASVVLFTLAEAQRIVDLPADQFSNIGVVAEAGVSQDELREPHCVQRRVGRERRGLTGARVTEENQDDVDAAPRVFNRSCSSSRRSRCSSRASSSTTRSRSSSRSARARWRCCGRSARATRQVLASILGEALVVGFLASAARVRRRHPARGRAQGAARRGRASTSPRSDIVDPADRARSRRSSSGRPSRCSPRSFPARKASRVPPVAAMRDVAIERPARVRPPDGHRLRRSSVVGVAAWCSYALFAMPDNASAVPRPRRGRACSSASFVLGPVIARPLSRVHRRAAAARSRGMTGTLAARTRSATRAARRRRRPRLMIGVALVGFITIFAASAKASISQ